MARIKADRAPLAGERGVRTHIYLPPGDLGDLDEIAAELATIGVASRNGTIVYLKEMYKARKKVRAVKGLEGPVPLYEPGDLVV